MVLHVEAAPQYGIDIDIYVLMDLWHGDCRSMGIVPPEAGEAGDFVITGSMDQWMKVGRKELDVVKGMMQGKLRLKGDLPTIVRAVKASIRLVDIKLGGRGEVPRRIEPRRGRAYPRLDNPPGRAVRPGAGSRRLGPGSLRSPPPAGAGQSPSRW